MSQRISERLLGIGKSATLAIDEKAKQLRSAGKPVISYAAGEPDFPTPEHIVNACKAAAELQHNHVYTATAGLPELRHAIARKTLTDSSLEVSASQIIVTNGCKQAVYMACQAILDPNDEVILPAPYWTTYPESVRLAGAKAIVVQTHAGFCVGADQLESVLTDKTRAIMLSSPSNPSGAVYSLDSLREIATFAKQHGLWVISDEIYQNIYYKEGPAPTFGEAFPEIANRLILVNGLSKTYAMTGWRIGWLIAPPDVAASVLNLQSHMCSNVSNIMQRAAIEALNGPQDCVTVMRNEFKKRRDLMVGELRKIDGISVSSPDGAFFVYPDVSDLLGRDLAGRRVNSPRDLADLILDQALVATVPGEAFGTAKHLRLSYALDETSITEGMRRLSAVLSH